MSRTIFVSTVALLALTFVAATGPIARGQIAFGVNAAGNLFRFNVTTPSIVTTLGPVGFVPEGIDFRPGTNTLYAIDIGANASQLFTLNIASGAATPVGASFTSTGTVNAVAYNLTGNQTFGFDFNPKTLQGDNSMRIRLVGTSQTNLRLNSSTGQITNVDASLAFAGSGSAPFIDAAAYINNIPASSGTTALYDLDSRNNALLLQNPPNDGTVTQVGPFGVGIANAQRNIGFDVYTTPGSVDDSIGGDFGYAVLKRPDAPINGPLGAYLLYSVNLGTGGITNGALVGPAATPFDFEGGFAVRPTPVPEPTCLGLALAACAALVRRRRVASSTNR